MPAAMKRRMRAEFTRAGQGALSDARSRAGSWSRRIPAAINGKPESSGDRVGYTLRVSVAKAPHARAFEGLGQGGSFRHPVFGRDRWVDQNTRPYVWPAVRGRSAGMNAAIGAAYEDAARECGFR